MESKTKHQPIKKKPVCTVVQDTESHKLQFKSQEDEGANNLVESGLFPEFILLLLIKISSSQLVNFQPSLFLTKLQGEKEIGAVH